MRAWFRSLPFSTAVEYQQALLLQILLIGLGVLAISIIPLAFVFLGGDAFDLSLLAPIMIVIIFTAIALYMLRQGSFHTAAVLILVVILAIQMRSLLINGLEADRLPYFNYTIPILFAGLTVGRSAMYMTAGVITVAIGYVIATEKPYADGDQVFVAFLLVLGFFVFIVDRFGISLRDALESTRQQEAQLSVERERLQVTLTSIGDAVMATDVHGKISFMNNVAEQVTGWQLNEAIGQQLNKVFRIINEETRLPVESPYDKVIRSGQIVGLANHTLLIRKDGQEVPIDDSGAPIRNAQGEIDGITLVFRDISERRQMEHQTQEHHRLVDVLLQTALNMSSSYDLGEVAEYLLETLHRVLPSDFAYLMLRDPINITKMYGSREHGLDKFEGAFEALQDPVTQLSRLQTMLQTRQPLLISDTRQLKHWMEFPEGEPLRSFLGVPILNDKEVIGFIGLHSLVENFFREEQVPRLQFFASQIGAVIQNAQLRQQIQEFAVMEDRQHLARELHDSVTQTLFASTVVAKMLLETEKDLSEKVKAQLEKLRRLNHGALADMRTLLLELRQADISVIELPDLMRQLSTAAMGNSKLTIETYLHGKAKLPPDVHITFYKVAQEALNNIIKHAKATHAEIHLVTQPKHAMLTIKDNGVGFDPREKRSTQLGLQIMQERSISSGVDLKIESEIGVGTIISLEWNQPQ